MFYLTEEDVALLNRIRNKLDTAKGTGVSNSPTSLTIGGSVGRGKRGQTSGVAAGFWAETTAESAAGGDYSWKRQVFDGTSNLGDPSTARTGTENAQEAHGLKGVPVGTRVWMRFLGYDGSGNARYIFHALSYGTMIALDLTQTGGSAGDDTTQCSYTYTVATLGGINLATVVNPTASPHVYNRPSLGAMVAADAGIGYWQDNAGTPELVIVHINEVPDPEAC